MTATFTPLSLPDILRQPSDKVRALQDRLLRETVELAYNHHPYYSKLMRKEGLEPRRYPELRRPCSPADSIENRLPRGPGRVSSRPGKRYQPRRDAMEDCLHDRDHDGPPGADLRRGPRPLHLHVCVQPAGADRAEGDRPHRQPVSPHLLSVGRLFPNPR